MLFRSLHRPLFMGSGRGLGGSGSINAMVYLRGSEADFRAWDTEGWSWSDVLPDFVPLLHRHQIRKIAMALDAGGRALVPLRLYFRDALVKVELALCTGKQLYDKRDDLKKKAELQEAEKALKGRR